jgi:hypothetical protein
MRTFGKASRKRFCLRFHEWLRAAIITFSCCVELADPVVISSVSMNDNNPVRLRKVKSQSPNLKGSNDHRRHSHGRDTPSRVPLGEKGSQYVITPVLVIWVVTHCAGMEITHGEAYFFIRNKSPGRSEHLHRDSDELWLATSVYTTVVCLP